MKKLIFSTFIFLMLLLSLISLTPTVFADDGQAKQDGILIPELGPVVDGLIPGVGGYKVFGSNAFATITPLPTAESKDGFGIFIEMVWSAYTDIWKEGVGGWPPASYIMIGSHGTQSTQSIEQIWVNGAIQKSGQGWYDSAEHHTSGMFAGCNTRMPDAQGTQVYIAHSWHHCYESGYQQWDPETEDTTEG